MFANWNAPIDKRKILFFLNSISFFKICEIALLWISTLWEMILSNGFVCISETMHSAYLWLFETMQAGLDCGVWCQTYWSHTQTTSTLSCCMLTEECERQRFLFDTSPDREVSSKLNDHWTLSLFHALGWCVSSENALWFHLAFTIYAYLIGWNLREASNTCMLQWVKADKTWCKLTNVPAYDFPFIIWLDPWLLVNCRTHACGGIPQLWIYIIVTYSGSRGRSTGPSPLPTTI